jgi:16S rRNA (cytosine1407-C5)-methyltransferase
MDSRFKKFPPGWAEQARRIIPAGRWHAAAAGFLTGRPHACRINTLKTTEAAALDSLNRAGIPTEAEKRLPLCHYLKRTSLKKIQGSVAYRKGEIYLQNPSSQVPVWLLAPRPGERILDACAAPGGKTGQIAACTQNIGELVALEPDPIRCERLRHNLNLLGARAEVLQQRLEVFARAGPPLFDRILLDAPCSGDGTFSLSERTSFAHWSPGFVSKAARLQRKLLVTAAALLRPGGRLVYSTCALARAENEDVITDFLAQHRDFKPILPRVLLPRALAPLLFNDQRILPSPSCEGFFLCALLKNPRPSSAERNAAKSSPGSCE